MSRPCQWPCPRTTSFDYRRVCHWRSSEAATPLRPFLALLAFLDLCVLLCQIWNRPHSCLDCWFLYSGRRPCPGRLFCSIPLSSFFSQSLYGGSWPGPGFIHLHWSASCSNCIRLHSYRHGRMPTIVFGVLLLGVLGHSGQWKSHRYQCNSDFSSIFFYYFCRRSSYIKLLKFVDHVCSGLKFRSKESAITLRCSSSLRSGVDKLHNKPSRSRVALFHQVRVSWPVT